MSPDIHAMTGAYAAHSLPDGEKREFQEHLKQCAACAAEVRELEATMARLGSALVTTPPPGMKARVMARIDPSRHLPPLEQRELVAPASASLPWSNPGGQDVRSSGVDAMSVPVSDDDIQPYSEVGLGTGEDDSHAPPIPGLTVKRRRRRRSRGSHRPPRRWPWVLAAAGAVVLLVTVAVLGATTVSLRNQVDDLQADRATVERILTAADATMATGEADGRSGHVVVAPSQESGVFFGSGLTPVPDGQTYQGWLVNSETDMRSAGLFLPDAEGRGVLVLTGDLMAAKGFAITLEPEGGSAQPTALPPLLAVPLPA